MQSFFKLFPQIKNKTCKNLNCAKSFCMFSSSKILLRCNILVLTKNLYKFFFYFYFCTVVTCMYSQFFSIMRCNCYQIFWTFPFFVEVPVSDTQALLPILLFHPYIPYISQQVLDHMCYSQISNL